MAPRPIVPSPAGQSALAVWRRERRAQARRRALAVAAAGIALGVAAIWAGAHFADQVGLGAWMGVARLSCRLGRDRPAGLAPRDADRWAGGAAGEQATAALLAGLAPRRWTVLHDLAVPGAGPTSTIWSSVPPACGWWTAKRSGGTYKRAGAGCG